MASPRYGHTCCSENYLSGYSGLLAKKEETSIGTKYMMGFQEDETGEAFADSFDHNTRVEVELPYNAAKTNYYFVMTDGTNNYVRQITKTWRHGDAVVFDLVNSIEISDTVGHLDSEHILIDDGTIYGKDWTNTMLTAMYNGQLGKTPSAKNMVGYILQSDKKLAGVPTPTPTSVTISYKGTEQTPYLMQGTNTTLGGDITGKNAGTYTISVTPKAGYTWLDGTTSPATISWELAKANLICKYNGEAVYVGETPRLLVTIYDSGIVDGETQDTISGLVMPTVTPPATLVEGQSYTLKPTGGSADNYVFRFYDSGTLSVISRDVKIIDKPVATEYIVDGEEHIGVPEGEGYTLSGTWKATASCAASTPKVNSYTATATLKDGYIWSDGLKKAASINWVIYEPVSLPELPKTMTYTGKLVYLISYSDAYNLGFGISSNYATEVGEYTTRFVPDSTHCWADVKDEINREARTYKWSIVKDTSGSQGGGSQTTKGQTVSANIYVPGELNSVLTGVNAYVTSKDTPLTTGTTPTKPVSNNAKITIDSDGTATITISIPNPVFTIQKIGGCDEVTVEKTEKSDDMVFQGSAPAGAPSERISSVTLSIPDFEYGKTYIFDSCEEYPTLLNQTWTVPLYLVIEKGASSLESNDVDPDKVLGKDKDEAVDIKTRENPDGSKHG